MMEPIMNSALWLACVFVGGIAGGLLVTWMIGGDDE